MISNYENSAFLKGATKTIENPEDEPYHNVFNNYKILIVILYLGDDKHETEIFEENAGNSLRKKGFNLDIIYSYGEAIAKISPSKIDFCPYSEIWIFCSKGDGSLPKKAEDTDSHKITIFQ